MDNQKLENNTSKYLRALSELDIIKANPILRLHYRSESENVDTKNEFTSSKSQKTIECKFCYFSSPTLKVLSKRKGLKPKQKLKRVILSCQICKNAYPNQMCTEIKPREKVHLEKSRNISNVSVKQKEIPKNVSNNQVPKKKRKDINAGLIIPPSIKPSNTKISKSSTFKSYHNLANKNQKLAQLLSKVDSTNAEIGTSRLNKFLDAGS